MSDTPTHGTDPVAVALDDYGAMLHRLTDTDRCLLRNLCEQLAALERAVGRVADVVEHWPTMEGAVGVERREPGGRLTQEEREGGI